MCGRFSLATTADDLAEFFGMDVFPEFDPHFNLSPSQPICALRQQEKEAKREALWMRWGLIPSWAKDPGIGNRMINARSETVAEKPAFRAAFKKRRCLVPADGFYEWKSEGRKKQPYFIRSRKDSIMAFAGLWELWSAPDGSEVTSCAILTTQANELMAPIHHRMPVILSPKDFNTWLDTEATKPDSLKKLMMPFSAKKLEAYPVSRFVSNPSNDSPQCIEKIELEDDGKKGKKQGTLFD